MTYRNSSRSNSLFSSNRPYSLQSTPLDSRTKAAEVKTRLSFSSVKSQNSIPSRGLMNGNYVHLSSSPINNNTLQTYFQNRGKYHMSRQNPDVLDRMYASSNQQLQKISDNSVLNDGQSPVMIGPSGHTGTVHFTPPYQTTLLRQMLNARRLRSTPPSSLVELATMKGGRLLRKSVASPVVVKLAGVKRSNREESGRGKIVNGREQSTPNPCDKEVVLKALRQRRKRWASSPPENHFFSLSATSPPMAKRPRTNEVEPENAITATRKCVNVLPSNTTPAVKRSKVKGHGGPSNIISLSEEEEEFMVREEDEDFVVMEEGEEEERGSLAQEPPSVNGAVLKNSESDNRKVKHLTSGHTPPIINEVEMNKKREESLHALKAVFKSCDGDEKKDTLRKKLPIFCATGNKPHLPTPLSSHLVTREDLRKERETAAAKLKAFMEADDETDGPTPSSSSQPSDLAPSSTGLALPLASSSNKPQTKGVTFAPLPTPFSIPDGSVQLGGTSKPKTTQSGKGQSPLLTSITAPLSLSKSLTDSATGHTSSQNQKTTTGQVQSPHPSTVQQNHEIRKSSDSPTVSSGSQLTQASLQLRPTMSTSTQPSVLGQTMLPASTQPSLSGQTLLPVSTQPSLSGQTLLLASTQPSLSGQTLLLASTQPSLSSQTLLPASTRPSLSGQTLLLTSTQPSLSGQTLLPASTQPSLSGQTLLPASTQPSLSGQSLLPASTQPSLSGHTLLPASTQPSLSGQTLLPASTQLSLSLGQTMPASSLLGQTLLPPSSLSGQTLLPTSTQPSQTLPASSLLGQTLLPASTQPSLSGPALPTPSLSGQTLLLPTSLSGQTLMPASTQPSLSGQTLPTPILSGQALLPARATQPSLSGQTLLPAFTQPSLSIQPAPVAKTAFTFTSQVNTSGLFNNVFSLGSQSTQPSLFNPITQPVTKTSLSLFNSTTHQSSSTTKPSIFSQASQSSIFSQTSQPGGQQLSMFKQQPSLFNPTTQPTAQLSMFKQQLPQPAASEPINTLFSKVAAGYQFTLGSSGSEGANLMGSSAQSGISHLGTNQQSGGVPQFKFGQPQQQTSANGLFNKGPSNQGGQSLFGKESTNPISFNFTANRVPNLSGNSGTLVTQQPNTSNQFVFGQNNASSAVAGPRQQQNQSFTFGQTNTAFNSPISAFGAEMNQQQNNMFGGSLNFSQSPQTVFGSPLINFSAGVDSTPTGRKLVRGRRKKK